MKYRKKPGVVVEAVQISDREPAPDWLGKAYSDGRATRDTAAGFVLIKTLEGFMEARPGDWIIQGVEGEIYPCKASIFEKTYEPAERGPVTWQGDATTLEAMDAEMRSCGHITELPRDETITRLRQTIEECKAQIANLMAGSRGRMITSPRLDTHGFAENEPLPLDLANGSLNLGSAIDAPDPAQAEPAGPRYKRFEGAICGEINGCSMENGSDTPNFILAEFLVGVLTLWDRANQQRDKWYGGSHRELKGQLEAEGEHTAAANANIDRLNTEIERVTRRQQGDLAGKDGS